MEFPHVEYEGLLLLCKIVEFMIMLRAIVQRTLRIRSIDSENVTTPVNQGSAFVQELNFPVDVA